ncbi:MATE family efflux transporter [Emergencia sp. 1XD21-10]|uniref:MATE family efflux transporter n=1 Tax=Emergencia sp. 1XD21-10 TaxID=2304569 RepID=UPI00137ADBAF|nr:MATE family efflux transporter [Emergencia sp. 1XD21-10]NCE97898.1 MATE family efflux transporter [Emergencia sp. 1XD21-10]
MQKKETRGQPTTLTSGSIKKQLVLFSIPIFLGTLLQQLYNVIDAVVAGRFVSEDALSAIGVSVPIYLLFVSVILGLAIGITILLAQFFGAKQFEQIKSLISTMSIFLLVLGLVMAFGGAILAKPLLKITQTPAELLGLASVYLRTVFLGIPFSILYNLLGAVMRSFGETKMPLFALIVSSIINLVLNIVFVRNGGGVIGIAASTIIAQAISGVYLLIQLRKKFPMAIPMISELSFDKELLKLSLKICIPIIIQQLAVFLGMLIVQGFINQLGNASIGGMTAASRIEAFILLPVQALGNALSIFAGQNIGANEENRMKQGTRFGIMLAIVITALLSIVLLLWGKKILGLIIGNNEEMILSGYSYFHICLWFYPINALIYGLGGVLSGVGDTLIAGIHSLASILVKLFVTVLLIGKLGLLSIAIASCLGWCVASAIVIMRYKGNKWQSKVVVKTIQN